MKLARRLGPMCSGRRVAVERDDDGIREGEWQRRCDDRGEVGLKVLEPARLRTRRSRRNQEVYGHLGGGVPPSLARGVARGVRFGVESTLPQSLADLLVPLLVEHRDGEPEVEVARPDVPSDVSPLLVDDQVRDKPPITTTSSQRSPRIVATYRHRPRASSASSGG